MAGKKIWQIVDKTGNVKVLTNEYCEWITEPTAHFTKDEAENILADWFLQYYKVGGEKEFSRYGYHIVKDKNKARELFNKKKTKKRNGREEENLQRGLSAGYQGCIALDFGKRNEWH